MKFRDIFILVFLCLCIGWNYGCDKKTSDENEAIKLAQVNDTYLTLQEARNNIPAFLMAQDSIKALQNYRKKWIQEQLLLTEAHKKQLMKQAKVQKQLAQAQDQIAIQALKESIMARFNQDETVTDQEVRNYYEEHKEELKLRQRYIQFRHIATKNIEAARAAHEELEEGGAWPAVAFTYSIEAEEKVQQAQKYWPQTVILNEVPVMKELLPSLESGQVSAIQQVKGVYHVVQLVDTQERGTAAKPDWLMKELKKWLLAEKRRKYYNSYVKNLYFNAESNNELKVFDVLKTTTSIKTDSVNANKSND